MDKRPGANQTTGLASQPLFPVILSVNNLKYEYNFDEFEWAEVDGSSQQLENAGQELEEIQQYAKALLQQNQANDLHCVTLAKNVQQIEELSKQAREQEATLDEEYVKQTVDFKFLNMAAEDVKSYEKKIAESFLQI